MSETFSPNAVDAPTAQPLEGIVLFLSALALSLATFLVVLDYSIANVSIPYIAGDIGISTDQGTYVITAFAVGSAIALPVTGWLTKRVGLVRLLVLSLLGFVFFSWVCGMSRTIVVLVIARFLQGLASGPLLPISQTLIVLIFPNHRRNAALAFWGTVVIVAPILGPILGGWISYDYRWPWIFFINIPIGLFSTAILLLFLKPFETKRQKIPLDWVGLLLLAICVSCLQFLLDKGEQFDWMRSRIILSCAIISFVSFVYLIGWEMTHPKPLLELRLLKIRSFTLSLIFIATMYAIYFGGVVLVPLWLQEYMGYTPIWAGFAVAPLGLIPALFSSLIGKLITKIGVLIPIGIGLICFAISSFVGSIFTTDVDLFFIAFTRFLFGFGLLFFIIPLFSLSIQDVPKEKLASATGLFHFVRAMLGGVGTSIFTTLWTRRSIFHHANIVAEILPNHNPSFDLYQQLSQLQIKGEKAQALINDMVDVQASVLGINDCFYLMGWIFIGCIPILLLGIHKKKKTA